ncbi:MAG: EthD family reductase, partial [Actinomycetota bacterium]
INNHAPIARDGYNALRGYVVNLVTRVPEGQEAPYDGVAELTWDDRDGMKADFATEASKRSTEDLGNFTNGFGLLFVEQTVVK